MGNFLPVQKEHLKVQREKHGHTQKELAHILGCTEKTYRSWELGNKSPAACFLIQLSELYHVSTDYLLGLIEEKDHDMQFACDYTGLSAAAIEQIQYYSKINPIHPIFLKRILENDLFYSAVGEMFNTFMSAGELNQALENNRIADIRSSLDRCKLSKFNYSDLISKLFDESLSSFSAQIREAEKYILSHPLFEIKMKK